MKWEYAIQNWGNSKCPVAIYKNENGKTCLSIYGNNCCIYSVSGNDFIKGKAFTKQDYVNRCGSGRKLASVGIGDWLDCARVFFERDYQKQIREIRQELGI